MANKLPNQATAKSDVYSLGKISSSSAPSSQRDCLWLDAIVDTFRTVP